MTTRRTLRTVVLAMACLLIAPATATADMVVTSPPTYPIPADAPPGPPPIPAMPAAADAPPAPAPSVGLVTPGSQCGEWHEANAYGERWPTESVWWELHCVAQNVTYYNVCPGPACDAWCPYCFTETTDIDDYYVWNGTDAIFYGEAYSDLLVYDLYYADYSTGWYETHSWWDAAAALWFDVANDPPEVLTHELTVATSGSGSGHVVSSPAGIDCGATCAAAFDEGASVTLAATADASSLFLGWSGDCSGTGSCEVTLDRDRSVTASFASIVHRPDALIRVAGTSAWIGDGTYSATASGETFARSAVPGTTVSFEIGAQNDGNVSDALTMGGPGSSKGWTVRYFDGVADVTTAVVQGTYSIGSLPPGGSRVLRMTLSISPSIRVGTIQPYLVTVASHGLVDAVGVVVTVAR